MVESFVVDTDPPLHSARPKLASGVRGAADCELNGIAQGALEVFLDRPDPLVARSAPDEVEADGDRGCPSGTAVDLNESEWVFSRYRSG